MLLVALLALRLFSMAAAGRLHVQRAVVNAAMRMGCTVNGDRVCL